MTVPTDQTYPATAKNSAWQKKKTLADKAKKATKTGLGVTLVKAETEWAKIRWNSLDLSEFAQPTSLGEAQAHQQRAHSANEHQLLVQQYLKTAEEKAKATALNVTLSQPARTYATSVATALKQARQRLKQINIAEFQEEVNRQTRLAEERRHAEAEYRANLKDVTVTNKNGELLTAAKARRTDDHTLVIAVPVWQTPQSGRLALLQTTVKVSAEHADHAIFENDMKFAEIALGGGKVVLKS